MSKRVYVKNWVVTLKDGQEVKFVDTEEGKLQAMRYSKSVGGVEIKHERKKMY